MPALTELDDYLQDRGPAALVLRESLMAAEGTDGVLFPATYAAGNGFEGGYNIDVDPASGKSVALIDSVGSQANRLEPLFKQPEYKHLVPQVVITAGEKKVHLLEAGHRAGDAIVRCSSLKDEFQEAFKDVLRGNALTLAKKAPTSLVFGVWDSRDTQAKLPRLVSSTIRAFQVRKLRRSAQYNPSVDYFGEKLLPESTDKGVKDVYAERGYIHVPAAGTHGGIIADGGIRRDATLNLAAVRMLQAPTASETQALQRYILGLALVAFTYTTTGNLRQGCLLVRRPEGPHELVEVLPDGTRKPLKLTHEGVRDYATAAAKAFAVGPDREVPFDTGKAKADATKANDKKAGKKSAEK